MLPVARSVDMQAARCKCGIVTNLRSGTTPECYDCFKTRTGQNSYQILVLKPARRFR